MDSDRPILILTASAGAGHTVAAHAVQQTLHSLRPGAAVRVIDVLQWSNRFFRALYAQGYLRLVSHAPTAMGWLYDATDRYDHGPREASRLWFQNANSRHAMDSLVALHPRLVINTHFLPAEIVGQLRQRGRLDCPQVTVTTDFETHRLWVQPPTERYYTATDEGRAYLATWGVDPASVLVSGIPVRAEFESPADVEATRAQLGLEPGRPVVLLLCGGFGVGPTEQLLRELAELRAPAQVAVIAGRNTALRARLERIRFTNVGVAVRVLGFTDQMHLWMRSADLIVTKPGGLTASEALVCGTPMVVVNPIPGQEARNSDYLLEQGAAIKVNNPRLLRFRVDSLLADADRLATLRRRARAAGRPGAAEVIVRDALRLIEPAAPHMPARSEPGSAKRVG